MVCVCGDVLFVCVCVRLWRFLVYCYVGIVLLSCVVPCCVVIVCCVLFASIRLCCAHVCFVCLCCLCCVVFVLCLCCVCVWLI